MRTQSIKKGEIHMKKFFGEFKTFITRGNVMDMAVGVIIGGAFQAIINSLVNDVVMPVLSVITGGTDFSKWTITLVEAIDENTPAVTLNYGNFISAVINFLLMAFVIFTFVKIINNLTTKMQKKKDEEPAAPTTKECPFCKSEINIEATRCPHCTSELEEK